MSPTRQPLLSQAGHQEVIWNMVRARTLTLAQHLVNGESLDGQSALSFPSVLAGILGQNVNLKTWLFHYFALPTCGARWLWIISASAWYIFLHMVCQTNQSIFTKSTWTNTRQETWSNRGPIVNTICIYPSGEHQVYRRRSKGCHVTSR